MKTILTLLFLSAATAAAAQDTARKMQGPVPGMKVQVVEASCGMCSFGMPGSDCRLAVRIKGKAYYVDGMDIDGFGDAHAADGFCNAVRRAQVQGRVVNNGFKASYFRLLPGTVKEKGKKGTKGTKG